MPCFHPIPAELEFRGGTRRMKLHSKTPTHWIDCAKCLGCYDKKAALWGTRIMHETRSHSHNTFLTLTYGDANEPDGLSKRDLQLFWKRLRTSTQIRLKYYACGEYGDKTQRPHYHAAVLGLAPFPDTRKWDSSNNHSETLDHIWGNGRVLLSELTSDRASYVAGYVLKKAGYRKQIYCDEDGVDLEPPFQLMSNGLGKNWLTKYGTDLRHGYVQTDGRKTAIPRQYKIWLEETELGETIRQKQEEHRDKLKEPDKARLKDAEKIREQKVKQARKQHTI